MQDSPGPRAAATPSDKVSGDLRVGLLSWREGPQAGGPLSSLGLRNSGLPQTTDPQPHPSGQPMSSWGWEPEDGARGCAEKRGHPAGARRRDRLLRPLACSAVAPGRRAQPAGRWAGALCASRAPPSGQSRNWRSETQRVAQASPMAANHGRPLSTLTNHNSQAHSRPITQQHMVAEPIRTRDLKTRACGQHHAVILGKRCS